MEENKDETSNYSGYKGESLNYRGESLSNYAKDYNTKRGGNPDWDYMGESLSNYTDQELVNETTIFSPVAVEESDYKGCRKYCKGELGHGGGFLRMFGGGGKSGRQEFRKCNRGCKASGGAAALLDQATTDDLMARMEDEGNGEGTSPIVWLMVGVIILALVGGGYMLLRKKKK